jgi:hypothetical protein
MLLRMRSMNVNRERRNLDVYQISIGNFTIVYRYMCDIAISNDC